MRSEISLWLRATKMRRHEFLEVIARLIPGLKKKFASFFGLVGFFPSHA